MQDTTVRQLRTRPHPLVSAATALGALGFLVPGAWAFWWPRSFSDTIATYPPYNLHLFHDLGAFQLGLGAAMLAALIWSDALFVALAGGSVGLVLHAVAHFLDHDLGGRAGDPWLLSLLSLLLLTALALRGQSLRGQSLRGQSLRGQSLRGQGRR